MGLTETAVEVGIGAALIVVAARLLTPSATTVNAVTGAINAASQTLAGIQANIAGKPAPNLPTSQIPDDLLNWYIDGWFAGAGGGLFGLGSYDPTNWNSFVVQLQAMLLTSNSPNDMAGLNIPTYSTGYFDAKVAQYQNRAYTQPGGLGY